MIACNNRFKIKAKLEQQLKLDGMKELIEKGEMEEKEANMLGRRGAWGQQRSYHRIPSDIWSTTN
jgi:hypothetical protein